MDIGNVKIAIEDKFIILQLNEESSLLPQGDVLKKLGDILEYFSSQYQILCDFRDVNIITNDLIEFIEEFSFRNAKLLVDKKNEHFFKENVNSHMGIFPVNNSSTNFNYSKVNLELFLKHHDTPLYYNPLNNDLKHLWGLPTQSEFDLFDRLDNFDEHGKNNKYYQNYKEYLKYCEMSTTGIQLGTDIIFAKRYLEEFIFDVGQNSLLTQYSIQFNTENHVDIIPYQSNAIYNIENRNELILVKPHVLANKVGTIFQYELNQFSNLLSKKNIKESEIQKFLEKYPNFLRALGYKNIYPQVILERDDGTSLRPDFLLEPIGDSWWDILDIKLPRKDLILTSKRDRYKYSEAIHELHAQLREYSAYFENEKYANRIEEKYGIKCYKPKLIGVIGNKIPTNNERQIRRVMSSYSDVDILSFDKLYHIAKSRILI